MYRYCTVVADTGMFHDMFVCKSGLRQVQDDWAPTTGTTCAVDPFPVGIHGQASASLEIWAGYASSFDGPKGVYR
jgi:hypothetical protein